MKKIFAFLCVLSASARVLLAAGPNPLPNAQISGSSTISGTATVTGSSTLAVPSGSHLTVGGTDVATTVAEAAAAAPAASYSNVTNAALSGTYSTGNGSFVIGGAGQIISFTLPTNLQTMDGNLNFGGFSTFSGQVPWANVAGLGTSSTCATSCFAPASQGIVSSTSAVIGLSLVFSGNTITISGSGVPTAGNATLLGGNNATYYASAASISLYNNTAESGTIPIGNGQLVFTGAGQLSSFTLPTNVAVATGSYSGMYVGNAGNAVDAWALGLAVDTASGLGLSGTCSAAFNAHYGGYLHDKHFVCDVPLYTGTGLPFRIGSNSWVEFTGSGEFLSGSNSNCPVATNAHMTFVNLSGSTNFGPNNWYQSETPVVSATSPLYGDSNILLTGRGINSVALDGQMGLQTTTYWNLIGPMTVGPYASGTNPAAYYTFTGENPALAFFSGVNGLTIKDLRGQNAQTNGFGFDIENCAYVDEENVSYYHAPGVYLPTDDGDHSRGSIIHKFERNVISYNTFDDGHADNAGDDFTVYDGNGAQVPLWTSAIANIGSDHYLDEDVSTTGGGPAWYTLSSTNPNLNSVIYDSKFIERTLPADPAWLAAGGIVTQWTEEFAGFNRCTFTFLIDPSRPGYGLVTGGSNSDVTICDSVMTLSNTTAALYFNTGGGNMHRIRFVKNTCNEISGTSALIAQGGGGTSIDGLEISNNMVSRTFPKLFEDRDTTISADYNVGGVGNIWYGPQLTGTNVQQMWSGNITGLSGDFATDVGDQYGRDYISQVCETSTGNSILTVGSTANADNMRALMRFIVDKGWWGMTEAFVLSSQYNNGDLITPIGFGGLYNETAYREVQNPACTSTGTAGDFFNNAVGFQFNGENAAFTGTGTFTVVAFTSGSDWTGDAASSIYIGDGGTHFGIFQQGDGSGFQSYAAYGSSYVGTSLSGTTVSNHMVMSCSTYNGASLLLRVKEGASVSSTSTTVTNTTITPASLGFGGQWFGGTPRSITIGCVFVFQGVISPTDQDALYNEVSATVGSGWGL